MDKARELLQDSALPRYHRTRTLALRGSVVEHGCTLPSLDKCLPFHSDRRENKRCCVEADILWRVVRRLHADENEKNDSAMDELRDYILELRAVLDKEQAKAGDDEDVGDDETAV